MTDTPSAHPAGRPVARLARATQRYGDVVALDSLDLEVRSGEVLALLGPNGAGKTTAINLLLGLLRPTSGEVTLFGYRPWRPAARQRVGAMLQVSKVPETLRVREHIEITSSYYPAPLALSRVLEEAGLAGLEERPFGKLSGGQQQRLLFALAICGDPELLFLDEPTVGLDVEARRAFWECIHRLAAHGRTVLLTTHYLEEADALASRIVVLHRGSKVAEGSPSEVKALASGRRVLCRTTLAPAQVAAWPTVDGVRRRHQRLEITTARAEEVVRRLLQEDPELGELEVINAGLEEAMLALTGAPVSKGSEQEVAA